MESKIRSETNFTATLNGPQGSVSAKAMKSVELMEWALRRLNHITGELKYTKSNLLSCMTLDVENIHLTVHTKQVNMSMLEYTRSFGATMREALKRITIWGPMITQVVSPGTLKQIEQYHSTTYC